MEPKKPRVLLKNQKHIDFCIEYITSNFNPTQSYIKVFGCSYSSAAVGASRLLKRKDIKDFIEAYLKDMAEEAKEYRDEGVRAFLSDRGKILMEYVKIASTPIHEKHPDKFKALQVLSKATGIFTEDGQFTEDFAKEFYKGTKEESE